MKRDFSSGLQGLKSRNIVIGSKRTSIRLEQSMWMMLEEIAIQEEMPLNEIFTMLAARINDAVRGADARAPESRRSARGSDIVTFSSAVRVYICSYYRQRASEAGHRRAGHGAGNPFAGTPLDPPDGDRSKIEPRKAVLHKG